jgi:hypothetical protein
MIRTAAIMAASALAVAACAVGSPQRSDGAAAPVGGGLAWPYGDRDPAYGRTPGDDVYPWPLGQDKLDP